MSNHKKMLLSLIAGAYFFPIIAFGMTTVAGEEKRTAVPQIEVKKNSRILLLSWNGPYLSTTEGTLYTTGITIVDHANIDKKNLPTMDAPPYVEFTIVNNQVIQVDIFSSL